MRIYYNQNNVTMLTTTEAFDHITQSYSFITNAWLSV